MSERKVLNKYFPPDFDPSKIPRRKMPKDQQQVVRLMAPFSMRCTTCGEYIYKGKKFNARKETVQGEEYYGIKIFRFYIKCTQCSSEITFKTDPRNSDYNAEHGAQRNFEPWRKDDGPLAPEVDKLDLLEEEEEKANNPMEALETKAIDSRREMDILDALQSIKSRNARMEKAATGDEDKILQRVSSGVEVGDREVEKKLTEYELQRRKEAEEDEEEVRRVFGRAYLDGVPDIELGGGVAGSSSEDGASSGPSTPRDDLESSASPVASTSKPSTSSSTAPVSVKRKLDAVEPTALSLLSEKSKSLVSTTSMQPPPKKKGKNNALAAKLGIKLKK